MGTDGRSLGRVASSIALFLMGKHKPIYDPSTDCGDYVVAVGCHDLRTTGKKRFQKKYYTHTTRPGSLRSMTMDKMFEKWGGGEVLRRAVRGMLPKNRLRDKRLARLKSMFFLPIGANWWIWFLDWSANGVRSVRGSRSPLQGQHRQVREPVGHWKHAGGAAGVQGGQGLRLGTRLKKDWSTFQAVLFRRLLCHWSVSIV